MGEAIDGRADQYALAATAFHLLAGTPPFQHSNAAVVISKHLNAPPPPLAEHRPELARLGQMLSKALAKDPAARYPRCLDFARALGEALATTPRLEPPIQPVAPWPPPQHPAPLPPPYPMPMPYPYPAAGPPPKSRRALTVLVPLLLLVLLVGAVGFAVPQLLRPAPTPSTLAPRWEPYVAYGKQFTVWLTSLSAQSAESDVQRLLDGSTGQFHDDFANRSCDFRKVVVESKVTTQGTVNAAALDSINGSTAHVLVAATSKITDNAGAAQEPRSWRLAVQVEKIGDDYKVSKLDFVP